MAAEELRQALRTVAAGETYFTGEVGIVLGERRQQPDLTKREWEILRYMGAGYNNEAISALSNRPQGRGAYLLARFSPGSRRAGKSVTRQERHLR